MTKQYYHICELHNTVCVCVYVCVCVHSVMSNSLDSTEYNLPGSSVHGILQARIPEWVAISFSRDDTVYPVTNAIFESFKSRYGNRGSLIQD